MGKRQYRDRRRVAAFFLPALPLAVGGVIALNSAPGAFDTDDWPAPASHEIDFDRDIKPILQANCIRCHATSHEDNPKGGFSIDTREDVLEGGDTGPAVVPGASEESHLIELVSGPAPEMPDMGTPLSDDDISLLRAWIDQGLPWEEGHTFAVREEVDIEPHRPELPPAEEGASANPVDRLLNSYLDEYEVDKSGSVSDRTFIRRASLDLIGLTPTPEEVEAFIEEDHPDKRAELVRALLERREDYATHWLAFWNDRLRNDYSGPGFIDDGRRQITAWLYESLYDNKPYDQFVRELIDPVPESQGFVHGIQWRGVVNAAQRSEMQVAQTVSQVFLGTRLKCASCHDSFTDRWLLKDVYALASVFAEDPMEIYRCNEPTGEYAEPGIIFPQLGSIDAEAPVEERRKQLAELLTSEENGRFARTIVNHLWAELMGRGIIHPVDVMDGRAWEQDLLDWLASDLVDHDYDLKRTLELIATSEVYQLPADRAGEPRRRNYVFRGPLVKRMTAEQFVDAISRVTGIWQDVAPGMEQRDGRGQGGQLAAFRDVWQQMEGEGVGSVLQQARADWIWSDTELDRPAEQSERVYFRKTVEVHNEHHHVPGAVVADDQFVLYVNGEKVAEWQDGIRPVGVELSNHLVQGTNTLAVEVYNAGGPGGLLFYANGLYEGEPVWRVGSDASWRFTQDAGEGWYEPDFEADDWQEAAVLAPLDGGPWAIDPDQFGQALASTPSHEGGPSPHSVRASVAFRDPLMESLGRPERSQVIVDRESRATMLQALELTNGQTLDDMVRNGTERLLDEQSGADTARLVETIYARALSRQPQETELAIARDLLGSEPGQEEVADLLWAVAMLPEFQLIH